MTYDRVSQFEWDGTAIQYGCMYGNEKIVVIKAGLGGDYIGNEEKYVRIAQRLHKGYGCSVISISNPYRENSRTYGDREIISDFLREQASNSPQMYFFGNSNGCIKGLELAAGGLTFQRMLLINMPLMINFHKTKKWLAEIPQTEVIAVYGDRDPSYTYIPFIDGRINHLKTRIIPGADHNFAGKTDIFVALADSLMGPNE